MNRSMRGNGYVCLAIVLAIAAIGALSAFPKTAKGQTHTGMIAPARSQWTPDRRLTFDPADSQLSYNFAWSVAADEVGRVHVVWYDKRDGNSQIYYKRSMDGGESWEPDVRLSTDPAWREHPAIAASGNHVYVVWHDARNEGLDIYFKSSSDGGVTWSGEFPLTSDGSSAHASIAAQGETVQVIWTGYQEGQTEIYTSHSTDAGLSWAVANRLSELLNDSWVPTIAISGQQIYAAWVDIQDGNEEEYFRHSTDGGETWEPIIRLTNNRANSWAPSIVASGKTVHLVWFDQQDSPIQPLDAEEKLNAALRLLNLSVEPAPVGVMVTHPELAAQRRVAEKFQLIQSVVLRWIAQGGDVLKLQMILQQLEALGQQGASYLEKDRKLNEALNLMALSYTSGPTDDLPKIHYQEALSIRVQDKIKQIQAAAPVWGQNGGNLQQLEAMLREFQQALTVATTEWEVYYRRSTDGGQTWEPVQRLTNAPLPSMRPTIALAGNDLHVVWFDYRDGNAEIYYKHSPDAGTNWMPDERLTYSPGNSLHPTVTAKQGAVHVVWFDNRDGNSEIYYKRLHQLANIRSLPGR
ncbi:MAG TPA: sialidase family protein [Blastocatellia bacterium]|nr:sialidase family protein [Blastocatellia bacterium]